MIDFISKLKRIIGMSVRQSFCLLLRCWQSVFMFGITKSVWRLDNERFNMALSQSANCTETC